ncbi:MAG: hypothetical protein GC162_10870 [Planctomycetes bacterium]|nr:hypothetical protein [Planctomycetota bacterium]
MSHAHGNLFDGITAIQDAGGIDGFAREVLAETKTLGFKRLDERKITNKRDAIDVFDAALDDVLIRRLDDDGRRIMKEAAIEALMQGDPNGKLTAADSARVDAATMRAVDRLDAVGRAVIEKVYQIKANKK